MPFDIVRNDIVLMQADAIVNTANPYPIIGSGTDAQIHSMAGPELLDAREDIGNIAVGHSAITPAFRLNAKYVIHTVGPVWRGGFCDEEKLLRSCYDSALALAAEHGCESVAFPLISAGHYGFPKDKALQIAIAAFADFLTQHDMQIWLVVFNREAYRLSEKLFSQVASYIDENYVDAVEEWEYLDVPGGEYDFREAYDAYGNFASFDDSDCAPSCNYAPSCYPREYARESRAECMPAPAKPMPMSLRDMLRQEDAGFTETLLKRIDKSGKKDSEIYKKACLTKQHFSKIRNNPKYKPTKQTAIALALALELNLEETRDLIGRAGYALTNSSKFDLIIRYFIEQKVYNVVEINMALYEFDQSLLGS